MNIIIKDGPAQLGKSAGILAAQTIGQAIKEKGFANIILATGTSQFETLRQLSKEKIDWGRVSLFHLDEYIGLPENSAASFRKYLRERFIQKVTPLKTIHLINGEAEPVAECCDWESLSKKRLSTWHW